MQLQRKIRVLLGQKVFFDFSPFFLICFDQHYVLCFELLFTVATTSYATSTICTAVGGVGTSTKDQSVGKFRSV
jgi:hypothetical protein